MVIGNSPKRILKNKMSERSRKKITTVREHQMKVPKSEKNPDGFAIRDQHLRRLQGTYLDSKEIESILKTYDRSDIPFPTKGKLNIYKGADKYDDTIAVWTDFFNKKFNADPPIDPDVIKALIASESSFDSNPKQNRKIARGIAQITKSTLKIVQDPNGEAKSFIFKGIRQKDLADPNVCIAIAVRWLHRKKETATGKLGKAPSHEDIILEYKGLLKSTSAYKIAGLKKYREAYEALKK